MPVLFVFIALFALALLGGAILAYPLYLLLINWFEPDFERVVSRCVLIVAVVLLIAIFKRLGFGSWQETGFNSSPTQFGRHLLKGFGAGILIMLPLVAGLLISKNRVVDVGWDWSPHGLLLLLITAVTTGLLITLIEEVFFRGVMLGAIRRYHSTIFAVAATSVVYAAVHFLQPEPYPITPDWSSGFTVIKDAFLSLSQPLQIMDSFIALLLAGWLLAVVRMRSGTLAICMGIHAGWVFTIKVFKRVTNSNDYAEYAWLSGDYDGVIGWLAAICIAGALVIYVGMKKERC